MKKVRQLHLYLGVLFAPAIIFFSLTGALQTFGWHESEGGAQHPAWIAKLAEIHKNQHLAAPQEQANSGAGDKDKSETRPAVEERSANTGTTEARPENAATKPGASRPPREEPQRRGPSPLPLKIFVFLMSIGLITTTLLGVYMAYKFNRDRRIIWALLALGTLLPILLLYI